MTKQDNILNTDIYYKLTYSKAYFEFNSCHLRKTKTNVLYDLVRRICAICNYLTNRNKWLLYLGEYIIHRNYPKPMIMTGINKTNSHNITELRQVSPLPIKLRIRPPLFIHKTYIIQRYLALYKRADQLWKGVLSCKT